MRELRSKPQGILTFTAQAEENSEEEAGRGSQDVSRTRHRNHALQRQSCKEGEVKRIKCFGKVRQNSD